MTALDDALNENDVHFGPHQLRAYWRESDGAGEAAINSDTPTNLSQQFSGEMTIEHSLIDGLPQPVTRTNGAEGSGILTAGLLGREALELGTSGVRAYDGAGGSWDTGAATTTITAPIPPTAVLGDFLVSVILVDDATAMLIQDFDDVKDTWNFMGQVGDSPLAIWAYGKPRWKSNNPQLTLMADKPVDFVSVTLAFWAKNPAGMMMDYDIPEGAFSGEASSTTTHSISLKQTKYGYTVGFWGATSASGTITPTAPMVSHGAPSGNGLLLASALSPLTHPGYQTPTATQVAANAVMCKLALTLAPYTRPKMDARQYFSPFNDKSPVYGYDRDTADVEAAIRTITSIGPWDQDLFAGQMQGIAIRGREAEMQAVSKTRINMNRSILLPQVSGRRENATIDYLATYLMARGSSFVGPAPNRWTRYWAPLYGSTHAHWDHYKSYSASYYFESAPNPMLRFGRKYPESIPGKWMTAMYGQQTSTRIDEIWLVPASLHKMSTDDFPHLWENGQSGPVMQDMMSLQNSKGRAMFYVRGDAAVSAPAYVSASDDFLVKGQIHVSRPAALGGDRVGSVEFGIASNSRNPYINMGSDAAGYLSVSFVFAGLPTDGQWYSVGFSWDFAAGTANCNFLGSTITSSLWSSGGYNVTTGLAVNESTSRARGDSYSINIRSHLPFSDFLLDFGETYVAGQWNEHFPTPLAPGANAIMRPTHILLSAIAEPSVVNAWDELVEVARTAIAAVRCNEDDVIEFLPQQYFGEPALMTSTAVQDTSKNAMDMDVEIDPSKTRNVFTVKFEDTYTDTNHQPVLQSMSGIEIPKGLSEVTYTLDLPAVEIHGQAQQTGATWEIYNLTSSQISTPNLPVDQHYITANTNSDGGGTVLDNTKVKATIVSWDVGSITIQFNNRTSATAYLANNGNQVPFLLIRGYGVRSSTGYVTQREPDSVAIRGERALESEYKWVQNRGVATVLGLDVLNKISKPMPEVSTIVFGDPRRRPGDLVTLLDAEGTKVSGTWRVMSVGHAVDGAEYTQGLRLIPVDPIGVWDSSAWDNAVWDE